MTSRRLEYLLEKRALVALVASDDEIADFWWKSLRAYRDSHVPGLSPAGAFNAAYEAALDAATVLVREAGYQVKSSGGHHWATFHAVQGLESEELASFGRDLDDIRGERHDNVYGPKEDQALAAKRRDRLHALLADFLPVVYARLLERRPRLRGVLQDPRR